jgi:aminoglycoside phosphotransferase (APT) family kinase protein
VASLDHGALCSRLQTWFYTKLGRVSDVEVTFKGVAEGGSSDTSFIDVGWRSGDGPMRQSLVLRREPSSFRVYPNPELGRQVDLLNALWTEGTVPVPQVVWFEPDPQVLGTPFFLMAKIAGRTLPTFPSYNASGWLADATPPERERLWVSAIESFARVHSVDPSLFPFLNCPSDGASGLDQQLTYWGRYQQTQLAQPPHRIFAEARRWLEDNAPTENRTGLSWGDARLGNLIFRGFECVGVLDWETASMGGAEADLGWWLFYDEFFSRGLGLVRLEGLGDRAATIALWEKLMGHRALNPPYYDIFAAYRVAQTIERVAMLHAAKGTVLPVGTGDQNPAIIVLARLMELPVTPSLVSPSDGGPRSLHSEHSSIIEGFPS